MLALITPDYSSPEWELLPGIVRSEVRRWLAAFSCAPTQGVSEWLKKTAEMMGVSHATARRKFYEIRNNGGDWTILVDARRCEAARAAIASSRQPQFTTYLLTLVEQSQRNNAAAFRRLKKNWAARETIPGYESFPGWPKVPAGWTPRNLSRIVAGETNNARMASIKIGTSSKTNPFLPTVLTTRVGLWPGAVIQLDDVWHDNYVTLGAKRELVRVLELGALDLFSAHRFHWAAKPRRKRENGTWETINAAAMRQFLAGMFHGSGYSAQGTMLMSEHNTAKVSDDIARALYDATRGLIRVDYQPIEGKQAALSGYWAGSEGGNFRAKACLESTHNLIHNDLAFLPMQTGSPSSGLKAPVVTDRIAGYIAKVMRDVLAKAPQRADQLRLPTLDFHSQFIPFLSDYYHFGLASRTDHQLQGWEELGHVITEFTAIPGSESYFGEEIFLGLPEVSQLAIREAARQNPALWTRRRKLSPLEVWNRRPSFNPIPPIVLCDILGGDLAREVTAARGYLEFSDQEISECPLIYQSRYCAGPLQGREIPHGEKVKMFVLPFTDATALVVDAKDRYLGEVALVKRVLSINPQAFQTEAPYEQRPEIRSSALQQAAGEKHSRIADILEPVRIRHREEVQEARDLREHNRKVISGAPITPEEIHSARVAAGHKGTRTAAATRLQAHGKAQNWDDWQAPASASAFDHLAEDEELPDAL